MSNIFNAWEQVPHQLGFLLNLDPPEHTQIRRSTSSPLTPSAACAAVAV